MSLFNTPNQSAVSRERQKAVLLLSDAGAQRSCIGRSSSGINQIQAVSMFFLVKKMRALLGYSAIL